MQHTLKFLNDFWIVICVISIIFGIVSIFINFKIKMSKAITTITSTVCFVLLIISAFVGNCYTNVPELVDKVKVSDAYQILSNNKLSYELMPGVLIKDTAESIINYQSIPAGTLIPINSTIIIGCYNERLEINEKENNASTVETSTNINNSTQSSIENNSNISPPDINEEISSEIENQKTNDLKSTSTVPYVVNLEQTKATKLIEESGLTFQVWWTEENNIASDEYIVINQSIPAESIVPKGTLVLLELRPSK